MWFLVQAAFLDHSLQIRGAAGFTSYRQDVLGQCFTAWSLGGGAETWTARVPPRTGLRDTVLGVVNTAGACHSCCFTNLTSLMKLPPPLFCFHLGSVIMAHFP